MDNKIQNHASKSCTLFIACREAIVLVAYQDGPHCSVGCGHNDPTLKVGDRITMRHAFELLKSDIAVRDVGLNKRLKVPVSQQQYDALVSLNYQSGNRYAPQVIAHINAGEIDAAADLFLQGDRNLAGIQSAGLRKRRLLEQAIFTHGDYGDLSLIPYWPDNPRTTKMQQYRVQPGDLD